MDKEHLHIIITGESGKARTLLIKKRSLRNLTLTLGLVTILLVIGSITGLHARRNNHTLQQQVADLTRTLEKETLVLRDDLQKENAGLKTQLEQQAKAYEDKIAALEKERDELFEGSISRLDERSKIIKTLMQQIGVKIEVEDDPDHSGGLFVAPNNALCDKLICETDRYLNLIRQIPLGRPIGTRISSRYGRRADPLNHKKAFHTGIDFKGNTGDKVQATGDGVVRTSAYNKSLGNHIIIKHGSGYETLYAHLSKRLVKKGQTVTRGTTIGLVGNTGRSTGSHLHYEVHYHNKTVDPMKFMQVARLLTSTK